MSRVRCCEIDLLGSAILVCGQSLINNNLPSAVHRFQAHPVLRELIWRSSPIFRTVQLNHPRRTSVPTLSVAVLTRLARSDAVGMKVRDAAAQRGKQHHINARMTKRSLSRPSRGIYREPRVGISRMNGMTFERTSGTWDPIRIQCSRFRPVVSHILQPPRNF